MCCRIITCFIDGYMRTTAVNVNFLKLQIQMQVFSRQDLTNELGNDQKTKELQLYYFLIFLK